MVQDALQKAFGTDYRVELFGSTRYGISSAKSDLDMVLLVRFLLFYFSLLQPFDRCRIRITLMVPHRGTSGMSNKLVRLFYNLSDPD